MMLAVLKGGGGAVLKTVQSRLYAPRVVVVIDKAILRGHLEYLGIRKGELRVVTWKKI